MGISHIGPLPASCLQICTLWTLQNYLKIFNYWDFWSPYDLCQQLFTKVLLITNGIKRQQQIADSEIITEYLVI